MIMLLLLISFLGKLNFREISTICKCEQLSKGDCNRISVYNACIWDSNLAICRMKQCSECNSLTQCNEINSCYWAGNQTNCLKKPILCQQFKFDENASYYCGQMGCDQTSYNVCTDKTDCTEFTEEFQCVRQGCYYNGEICLRNKCSNYRPDQCINSSSKCILSNKICRNKKCSDLISSKCDGTIVGNSMCHLKNSACTEIEPDMECDQIGSQKACIKSQAGCKWNGTSCSNLGCFDIEPSKCKETSLFTLGNNNKLCRQNHFLINQTKYCDDSFGEELNETTCVLNSKRTYYWFQKSSTDKGQCLPCLIKLYNTLEMRSILITLQAFFIIVFFI